MNKYSKKDVLNLMEEDIRIQFKNINEEELKHFSNNLFILCSAKVDNLNEQAIADKITYMNNLFVKNMERKNVNINSNNFDMEMCVYKKLEDKYIELLKN